MEDKDLPIKPESSAEANQPSKNLERLSDIGTIASVAGALLSVSVAMPVGLPVMFVAALAALGAGGMKIAASRARAAKIEEEMHRIAAQLAEAAKDEAARRASPKEGAATDTDTSPTKPE